MHKRRFHRVLLPCLAAFLLPFLLGCEGRKTTVSVSGQIEAESAGVGSLVGGRVIEVLVKEGDVVQPGQVLVRLDPAETAAAVQAAEAKLAQAQAILDKLEHGARPEEIQQAEAAAKRAQEQYQLALKGSRSQEIRAAEANADAARAHRDEAQSEFNRVNSLFQSKAVSQQVYDQARHALEAAEAQYTAAKERLDAVVQGSREEEIAMAKAASDQAAAALDLLRNGTRKEDIDAARAARDAAAADVERARVALNEKAIVSPQNGVIESMDIHPGDILQPGPAITVVNPDDLKLYVYVSEFMLGYLRLGEKVEMTTDSFGSETFEGTIVQIATEGQYTPRNLQTTEERVQQVFGTKVKLNSAGGKLRAGMTATVHLPAPPEVRKWVR